MSPHPQGTPRALRGRASSSAGLTWRLLVSPWSQALLVCFCFSAEERQGVNLSTSRQPAKGLLNPAMLPAHPSHHHQSWGTGLRSAPSRRPRSPGSQELGPAGCTHCHVPGPPWGLGTPTLVLQGLQSLLSLVVQLLQVRGPRGGEEDVVGAFLARRILHAQPLLSLALGSACGDRGVSLARGDTATFPPMHPHP